MRFPLAIAALIVTLAIWPATPAAATHYAAPGSATTSGSCAADAPCELYYAVSSAGPTEQVYLLPGNYGSPAARMTTDLLSDGRSLRGIPGAGRPVLYFDTSSPSSAVRANGQAHISDLTIDKAGDGFGLLVGSGSGSIDRVIVRTSSDYAVACAVTDFVIRDSACLTSGGYSTALTTIMPGSTSVSVRNVTARSTGAGSLGYSIYAEADPGPSLVSVDIRNSILRGGDKDVWVEAEDNIEHDATAIATIGNSNFATSELRTGGGWDIAKLIEDPAASNQTTPPLLAADDITQLAGSPTIDAGAALPDLGPSAIFGGPRIAGAAPDIGADELVPPTALPAGPIAPTPPPAILKAPRSVKLGKRVKLTVFCPVGCTLNLKLKIGHKSYALHSVKIKPTTRKHVSLRVTDKLRRATQRALRKHRHTKVKLYAQPVAGKEVGKTKTIKTSSHKSLAKKVGVDVQCALACEAWPTLKIGGRSYELPPVKVTNPATGKTRVTVKIPSRLRNAARSARHKHRRAKIKLQVRTMIEVQRGKTRHVRLR